MRTVILARVTSHKPANDRFIRLAGALLVLLGAVMAFFALAAESIFGGISAAVFIICGATLIYLHQ